MKLVILNHPFRYEAEKLCREFFPSEELEISFEESLDERDVVTSVEKDEISVSFNGKRIFKTVTPETETADRERILAQLMYKLLSKETGVSPKWGILTGIRPSKVMINKENELGVEGAKEYFRNELFVDEKKTELAGEVAKRERKIISLSSKNSFSLYISVPFCPTRCSYCSFISHSVESAKKLIPEYVERLIDEIKLTGEIASSLGLRLETVYYGGGTPTTLSAEQLSLVSSAIRESFDMKTVREYTVEAGRPDTVTREKLLALRENGVTRISINPQTFSDSVLEKIGRRHTGAQTLESFFLARDLGFDNINMDIIAGLPSDTLEGFSDTLREIIRLSPENVTVHTLSIKRSSRLNSENEKRSESLAGEMLETADTVLRQQYAPYYMYRQSKALESLENVGWCKDGFEGMYNIFMMEEVHTVLSCGAGAVTKLKSPAGPEIERIFNFKYPFEYIGKFGELVSRKERIKDFYNTYNLR